MMSRFLVLFAREPGREAQEKGFSRRAAAGFFARLAEDWWEAARSVGARLVIASPPEDRLAWQRRLGHAGSYLWVGQRGVSFGDRLENSARAAAALGGHSVIVGGDAVASASALEEAFAALEAGADAVLAPAPDGGVSMLALGFGDLDLLATIRPRRCDVFGNLRASLLSRRRRIFVVAATRDVDGRRALRALLAENQIVEPLRAIARGALTHANPPAHDLAPLLGRVGNRAPTFLRGPPVAA